MTRRCARLFDDSVQARVGSSELFADLTRNLQSVELPLTAANARFVLDALGKLRDAVASAEKPLGSVAGMVRSDALRPLAAESGLLVDKITALIHELAAARGEGRGSDAAVQLRSLGGRVDRPRGRTRPRPRLRAWRPPRAGAGRASALSIPSIPTMPCSASQPAQSSPPRARMSTARACGSRDSPRASATP